MKKNVSASIAAVRLLLLSALGATTGPAQTVPPLINYQGKLLGSNGLPISTGDYQLRFCMYNAATNGGQIWGPQVFNGQTSPGYGPLVSVVQGWFNVILGRTDTNGALLSDAFTTTNRFIDIQIGTNAPILPRQQILSAPYALQAEHATRAALADQALALLGSATTQAMTLYVSTNGSNLNDGLDQGHPKSTIQAAVDAVPNQIRHLVRIRASPGTYHESVRVMRAEPNSGVFEIRSVNDVPVDVEIDGLHEGVANDSHGLLLFNSTVNIANISFVNQRDAAILAIQRSALVAENCTILNGDRGIEVDDYSTGALQDCVFRSSNPGCDMFSCVTLRNNATPPWDPNNTRNNSTQDFTYGFDISHGVIVHAKVAPDVSNVSGLYHELTGGHYFSP